MFQAGTNVQSVAARQELCQATTLGYHINDPGSPLDREGPLLCPLNPFLPLAT